MGFESEKLLRICFTGGGGIVQSPRTCVRFRTLVRFVLFFKAKPSSMSDIWDIEAPATLARLSAFPLLKPLQRPEAEHPAMIGLLQPMHPVVLHPVVECPSAHIRNSTGDFDGQSKRDSPDCQRGGNSASHTLMTPRNTPRIPSVSESKPIHADIRAPRSATVQAHLIWPRTPACLIVNS